MPRISQSLFSDISLDISKSNGSLLFDRNTGKFFLDLFGFFSSLPLGYNHKILKSNNFITQVSEYSSVRVALCAFDNPLVHNFYQALVDTTESQEFTGLTLAETGSLAVEQAVKLALLTHGSSTPVYTIANSYHGIYGVSASLTFASGSALDRLPDKFAHNYDIETINTVQELRQASRLHKKIVLVVEPIRCTAGDLIIEDDLLDLIRELSNQDKLCLIVDEVQTGIFSTGSPWAFQKLRLDPKIIVFGKKAQVSGTLSKQIYSTNIGPGNPKYFSSTYDASPIDLIRAIHILSFIKENKISIMSNIFEMSSAVSSLVNKFLNVRDIRNHGCLIGCTFESQDQRDHIFDQLFKNYVLCNPTGTNDIRFRLPLNFSQSDLEFFKTVLSQVSLV